MINLLSREFILKNLLMNKFKSIKYTNIFRFSQDYYKVLGISKDSSLREIKKSYFKLVSLYHPDKNKSEVI